LQRPGSRRGSAGCHALFDLGVLGLTAELRIRVSSLYVARSDAGRHAVDDLSGHPLLALRPGQSVVELVHVDWHHRQVFKGADVQAA
jgi:putative restriction endonuclease